MTTTCSEIETSLRLLESEDQALLGNESEGDGSELSDSCESDFVESNGSERESEDPVSDIGPVEVLIEIPFGSNMKYEFDKTLGVLRCDRILHTPHAYPFNYGYFPNTLAGDGDDLDAVVMTKYPLAVPSIIRCRIIGALLTYDEKGNDEKIICVPDVGVDPEFKDVYSLKDLSTSERDKIKYFFRHYKRQEPNKFVKVRSFVGVAEAMRLFTEAQDRRTEGLSSTATEAHSSKTKDCVGASE